MQQSLNNEETNRNGEKEVIEMKKRTKRAIGWGLIVFGIYLLLVFFNIIPFTPRFENLFKEIKYLLILSIALIIIGVMLNDRIKDIFRE